MLSYRKVAVIDRDWSLYVVDGKLNGLNFAGNYAIIHDEDCIDLEFWDDFSRVVSCLINRNLGKRLQAYYG